MRVSLQLLPCLDEGRSYNPLIERRVATGADWSFGVFNQPKIVVSKSVKAKDDSNGGCSAGGFVEVEV